MTTCPSEPPIGNCLSQPWLPSKLNSTRSQSLVVHPIPPLSRRTAQSPIPRAPRGRGRRRGAKNPFPALVLSKGPVSLMVLMEKLLTALPINTVKLSSKRLPISLCRKCWTVAGTITWCVRVMRAPHLRQRSGTFTVTTESESATGNGESKSFSCDGELVEKDDETESKLQRPFEMNDRPLEKEVSLDWKKIMAEDFNYAYHVEKSPIKYFLAEMHAGNSLHRTVNLGNERVYNT